MYIYNIFRKELEKIELHMYRAKALYSMKTTALIRMYYNINTSVDPLQSKYISSLHVFPSKAMVVGPRVKELGFFFTISNLSLVEELSTLFF